MKVVLIAVAFTLVLVHGYGRPCEQASDNNAYARFVQKHILQESFDRRSKSAWEWYIRKYGLCHRTRQSFIMRRDQRRVEKICNGNGRPLLYSIGNLCISSSAMVVYDITVRDQKSCKIRRPVKSKKKVIVACNIVVNRCLPVHFEKYTNQRPDKRAGHCRPR